MLFEPLTCFTSISALAGLAHKQNEPQFVAVRALLVGVSAVLAANALLSTAVAIRLLESTSASTAGIVVSAFSFGVMLGAGLAARFVRRVGHIRSFSAFSGIATVATLAQLLVPDPGIWGVLRVAVGFSAAGTYLVVESWLSEATAPSRRGFVFAVYMTTCQLAMIGGQLTIRWVEPLGFEVIVIGALLYAAALIPVALTRTPQPEPPEITRTALTYLLRRTPVGVTGCIVAGCCSGILLSLGPVYAASTGLETDDISSFMGALVGGGLLLQAPVGWLSARIDRRALVELIAVGICMSAILCWLLPLQFEYVGVTALGAFVFVLYPAALAHAHDCVAQHEVVASSGTLILAYALGTTAAPMLGAFLIQGFGPRAYYPLIAFLSTMLVAYTLARLLTKRRAAPKTEALFLPTAHPVTTPAAQLPPAPQPHEPRFG